MTVVAAETGMSAIRTADAVRNGRTTAVDVVLRTVRSIEEHDPVLNAVTDVYLDRALEDAARVDALVRDGRDPGPLAGVPFAVKNLFDVQGHRTRAGSLIEPERGPAAADASAVRRLRDHGAVVVAATNMDEYAHGFTTENAHHGTTRNPRDTDRLAGGSSGGSAAVVAAGLVPLALGSDTNGSIRVPASLCGVFGLKPTFGRVSRTGTTLFVTSLDHVGPLASTAHDLAAAYDALAGPDDRDPVSAPGTPEACLPQMDRGVDGLRLAMAGGHFTEVAGDEVMSAVEAALRPLDVRRTVDVPGTAQACGASSVITSAEAGQRHLTRLRTRARDYDPAVRPALLAGALVPAVDYLAAQRFRRHYGEAVRTVFEDVDVLVMATTPCTAPRVGERFLRVRGEDLSIGANLGLLAQPWAFVGLPALSVPVRGPGDLPVGVQLVARPYDEAALFRVARALEIAGSTTGEQS
ncbi:MAG: amidohydrolase, AtzE family [Blastococcus sp.]|nr:amidohydrolase, AtzE family [Blastococcus sp.]